MYMMNLIDSRVIENVAQHVCATGKLNDKQTTTKVHGRTDWVLQFVINSVSYTVSNDNGITNTVILSPCPVLLFRHPRSDQPC